MGGDAVTGTGTGTVEAPAPGRVLGTRRLRKEDPELLSGEARFVDDLDVPGALHMALVRSPYARARLGTIDVTDTLAMPGVVGVYTGSDLSDLWAAPLPCAWP